MVPKKIVAPAHILNVFLQKNGLGLVNSSHGEAVYKIQVNIGGSHSALCLVTKISERETECSNALASPMPATADVDHFLPSGLTLQTCPKWTFFKSDL